MSSFVQLVRHRCTLIIEIAKQRPSKPRSRNSDAQIATASKYRSSKQRFVELRLLTDLTNYWQLFEGFRLFFFFFFYGPGDAVARVSRSFMGSLRILLSCAMHVASLVVIINYYAVLHFSYHFDPSFLLSSPFNISIYVAVLCYLGVSLILHPIHVSKVSQPLVS